VGGGYSDSGLSDQALIWTIARLQALTGLEFDCRAVRSNTKPRLDGAVIDSTAGWPLEHFLPHYRKVLSPVAIHHGWFTNSEDPNEEHINERVHWSVPAKRGNRTGTALQPAKSSCLGPDGQGGSNHRGGSNIYFAVTAISDGFAADRLRPANAGLAVPTVVPEH
jgi:hypothetical protein